LYFCKITLNIFFKFIDIFYEPRFYWVIYIYKKKLSKLCDTEQIFSGTILQDFWPLVFSIKHTPLCRCFTPWKVFSAISFELPEVIWFKLVSSRCQWRRWDKKFFLRKPVSCLCLKDLGQSVTSIHLHITQTIGNVCLSLAFPDRIRPP
jgi:hypothetical protein